MSEPRWLELDECLAIHELMLAQHGGLAGIRDAQLLDSALAKPRNRFAYERVPKSDLAASYAAGVIRNHPFLDGNKRTGFMLAAAFLELNGWEFVASEASVVEQTLGLAAGEVSEAEFAVWIGANAKESRA